MLQCVVVSIHGAECGALCCSVVGSVVGSVEQCVAVWCSVSLYLSMELSVLQYVAVWCSVVQCVAVCRCIYSWS